MSLSQKSNDLTQLLNVSKIQWFKIDFVAGNGTSNIQRQYSYTDASAVPGTYAYRLKQIDNDGSYKYSNETEVQVGMAMKILTLANYPNPFNPSTTISFSVGMYGYTSLRVYDIMGREVATLVNETRSAGSYEAIWNASKFASGVYFSRLESNGKVQIQKLVLIK